MPTSARELVGWSDQRWQAVQEAVDRALAHTAKCRQVIPTPKRPEMIGEKTVPFLMVTGPPYELKDEITAPVYLSVNLQFDDQHAADEAAILRLVESAATQLGSLEDERILKAQKGVSRNVKMVPWGLGTAAKIKERQVAKPADATSLLVAISEAVSTLGKANRAGSCGLILANEFLAWLQQPVRAGDAPPIHQAEQLIGSSQIAGTSVLDDAKKDEPFGVLVRLEPPAAEIVHTQLPTVTVLERTGGKTKLSVEEEIAPCVLDDKAIVRMLVK